MRLELTLPHYGCGVLAAERPVLKLSAVGPEGLEPSPPWVRTRHAAANTLIPITNREVFDRLHAFLLQGRDGRNRTDCLVFPKHAGGQCPSSRVVHRRFFAGASSPSSVHSGSYGNRTHLSALKGQYPVTARRTSRTRASGARVGREALESSSPGLQPGAKPSQLPTRRCERKRPDVAVTSGLGFVSGRGRASQAQWG